MLKIPAEYDRDIVPSKLMDISLQVSPCFTTRSLLFAGVLVNESGMIRTQMGTTVYQKIAAVHRTLCTIPHCNS
jgi:hypothetical protein